MAYVDPLAPLPIPSFDSYETLTGSGMSGVTPGFNPPMKPGFGQQLGGPLGIAQAGISGLQTLGSLWMGFKAAKMASKNFKFQKDITNTNLANQIKSYNTALADRARSRGVMEGQTQDQINQYVNDNSLNRSQSRPTGYNANYRDSAAAMPGQTTRPTASSISQYSEIARGLGERPANVDRDRDRRGEI